MATLPVTNTVCFQKRQVEFWILIIISIPRFVPYCKRETFNFFINCKHWQYCHICLHECVSEILVLSLKLLINILTIILLLMYGWLWSKTVWISGFRRCLFWVLGYLWKTWLGPTEGLKIHLMLKIIHYLICFLMEFRIY